MKKVLFIVAISSLFTGCAAVSTSIERSITPSIQLAQKDCAQMGFQIGTPQYQNCVLSVTNNIRNARVQQSIAAQDAADRARDAMSKTITCTGTGSIRTCSTF